MESRLTAQAEVTDDQGPGNILIAGEAKVAIRGIDPAHPTRAQAERSVGRKPKIFEGRCGPFIIHRTETRAGSPAIDFDGRVGLNDQC